MVATTHTGLVLRAGSRRVPIATRLSFDLDKPVASAASVVAHRRPGDSAPPGLAISYVRSVPCGPWAAGSGAPNWAIKEDPWPLARNTVRSETSKATAAWEAVRPSSDFSRMGALVMAWAGLLPALIILRSRPFSWDPRLDAIPLLNHGCHTSHNPTFLPTLASRLTPWNIRQSLFDRVLSSTLYVRAALVPGRCKYSCRIFTTSFLAGDIQKMLTETLGMRLPCTLITHDYANFG